MLPEVEAYKYPSLARLINLMAQDLNIASNRQNMFSLQESRLND